VYLTAAERLRAGLPLYQAEIDIPRLGWPYVYPPLLAQAFIPFASYGSAWWLLTTISLTGWLGSLGAILWGLGGPVWKSTRLEWRPVVLAGLVLWPAVLFDVLAGQVQLPLLALLTASWLALGARHARTAGVLLGLAIAIKPLPAMAVLILLAARQWQAAITTIAVAAVLLVASFSLVGWEQAVTYAFQAAPALDRFMTGNPSNRSLAMTVQLLGLEAPGWLGRGLSVALLTTGTVAALLWKPSGRQAMALAVTVFLLANPVLLPYHLVLAYLPICQAYADGGRRTRLVVAMLYAVMAVSMYVLPAPTDPPLMLGMKSGLPVAALLGLLIVQCRALGRGACSADSGQGRSSRRAQAER
jgi:hypothetical protein